MRAAAAGRGAARGAPRPTAGERAGASSDGASEDGARRGSIGPAASFAAPMTSSTAQRRRRRPGTVDLDVRPRPRRLVPGARRSAPSPTPVDGLPAEERTDDAARRARRAGHDASSTTSTRRRPTPPTPTCACTCSRTASCRPHASTSTASSASCPTSRGRASGPVDVDAGRARPHCAAAPSGRHLEVYGVDKFPRMTDYVVPDGRAHRRRRPRPPRRPPRRGHDGHARGLRATTTPARSAPRWSRAASAPGVVVGDGSDIGGGASIMGTLSGGGTAGHLRSASAACSARTPAWASRSATSASSRPGSTSPRARA